MLAPLLLSLVALQAAPADTNATRSGTYIGFELGTGHLGFRCAGCAQEGSATANHAAFRVGTMVSPRVALGLDLEFWKRQSNDDGATTPLLAATFFPSPRGSVFLQAGVGPAFFHGRSIPDGPTEKGMGIAAMVGVGSELRIEGGPAITPSISAFYNDIGGTTLVTSPERHGVNAFVVGIGFGLTWH